MSQQFSYLFMASLVTAGCGAVDVPDDLSGRRRSQDGSDVTPSLEATFDLGRCGFNPSKAEAILSSKRMAMIPQSMNVTTGGILVWQTKSTLNGMSILEDSLSRSVVTYSAQFSPTVDSAQSTAIMQKYTAGVSAEILPVAERAKIGETYADWKGVFCSFQPAMEIQRGMTEKVTISLDKPLPLAPVIVTDIERLRSEIGVKRAWKGITAKVTESSDPDVPVGSSWTGVAYSQPVARSAVLTGSAGKTVINSELGVKMTYDFGSESANRAMGLPKSVTWFIDTTTKSYKLMQVDFGDGTLQNYLPAK